MIVVEQGHTTSNYPNAPFPREIAEDPWIVYHGTSSVFETAIEREGLLPDTSLFTRGELQQVVEAFDSLRWAGRTAASLAVLKPFSLEHDFGQARGKPIFLAESAQRAMRFATHDFAGGEVARALRYSLEDLGAYLKDPSVREKHRADLERERRELQQVGALPPPEADTDLDWLAEKLRSLGDLPKRARRPAAEYRYGVVYAVRVQPQILSELEYSNSMGIKAFAAIPIHWLAAKALVLETHKHDVFQRPCLRELPVDQGIVAALRAAGR